MIEQLINTIQQLQGGQNMMETVLVGRYGSRENAQKALLAKQEANPDPQAFAEALSKDLNIPHFNSILEQLKDIQSPLDLASFQNPPTGELSKQITDQEVFAMQSIKEHVEDELPAFLGLHDAVNLAGQLFSHTLAQKLCFTKKEIREEIGKGISQKTFTKWLQLHFGDKYDGRKKINLIEYIEIYQMLLLKKDEKQFNFEFDSAAYLQRIKDGLIFTKERLFVITHSDYKTLAENCANIIPNFKEMDKFPFCIAQELIKKMNGHD